MTRKRKRPQRRLRPTVMDQLQRAAAFHHPDDKAARETWLASAVTRELTIESRCYYISEKEAELKDAGEYQILEPPFEKTESLDALADWAKQTGAVRVLTDAKGNTYVWGKRSEN